MVGREDEMDVDDVVDLAEANAWFDEVDDDPAEEVGLGEADPPAGATNKRPLVLLAVDDEECVEHEQGDNETHDEGLDHHHRLPDRADPTGSPFSPQPNKKRKTGGHGEQPQSSTIPSPPTNTASSVPWEAMFERLVAYKEKFGDTLVPKRYPDDPRLRTWVETQRAQYKKLERYVDERTGAERVKPSERLTADRLEKLNSVGFAWAAMKPRNPSDPDPPCTESDVLLGDGSEESDEDDNGSPAAPIDWDTMLQRLVAFKSTHGHCKVPKGYSEDRQLARWVERVRATVSRQDSAIASAPDSQLRACEEMEEQGPVDSSAFSPSLSLKVGSDSDNRVDMASASTLEETGVLQKQSTGKRDSTKRSNDALCISDERKEKLNELGFVWDLRGKRFEDHWDAMFRQLCEYREAHGDCLVPNRYDLNPKLAKWVETQRYTYSKLQQPPPTDESGVGGTHVSLEVGRPRGSRLTEGRIRRLNEMGFEWKVKNKMRQFHSKKWDEMFDRLRAYKEIHGDCLVPKRYAPDQKLATWVHTQRIQYKKSYASSVRSTSQDGDSEFAALDEKKESKDDDTFDRLSDERRQRLEEIGFCWSARVVDRPAARSKTAPRNSYDDQWDTMFERLKEYKLEHGDCLVPKRFKGDPKLGTWCDTQRVAYKRMKRKVAQPGMDSKPPLSATESQNADLRVEGPAVGRLTDERIRRLEEIGFVWSVRDDWHIHFEELKQFKKEHGHCNVPARYNENRKLGIFVSAQRSQYKALQMLENHQAADTTRVSLTSERIRLLNDLGFAWTVRSQSLIGESWNQKLNELKHYRDLHGHCNVPARYPENPGLGIWVGTQRTQYRLFMGAKEKGQNPQEVSSMTEERIEKLEELGFLWALRGDGRFLDSLANGFVFDLDTTTASHDVYHQHED